MRNKILCTLLALVLILSYSATVIANSEIINKGNLKGKELDTTSTDMFIAAMEQDNTTLRIIKVLIQRKIKLQIIL